MGERLEVVEQAQAVGDHRCLRARTHGLEEQPKKPVSKEVVLDTEYLGRGKDPWGNMRYGFHAETTVNRKDFGIAWNEVVEAGDLLVGDEVEVVLDIEAVPVQP